MTRIRRVAAPLAAVGAMLVGTAADEWPLSSRIMLIIGVMLICLAVALGVSKT